MFDKTRLPDDPKIGRMAVKSASAADCKNAIAAAVLLNKIPVVGPEAMRAFFEALNDQTHDEICGQAAMEEDRL